MTDERSSAGPAARGGGSKAGVPGGSGATDARRGSAAATHYAYRAARADGQIVDGRVEAGSREAALRQLRGQGLTPLRVDVAGPAAEAAGAAFGEAGRQSRSGWRGRLRADRGPDRNDVYTLTTELAVMLRAGLPLDRALRLLAGMSDKPSVVAMVHDLLAAVKAGNAFSQALLAHHAVFGDFYISMIRSGEAGGQLAEVLARLAEHLDRVKALRESVVSALIYPGILVAVAAMSVIFMLAFVVPRFESLFEDMGEALPLPTRIIVAAGHFVANWGWLVVLLGAAAGAGVRRWLRTPEGRDWRDRQLLALPVFGTVARKVEITRFARSMGTLLGNGVAIVTAVRIASDTIGNVRLRAALAGVGPVLKQGGRMADALAASGLFTPLAINLVRLGEETGRLDEMLLELARVYDAEVQIGVKRALGLLEPALILFLGALIAAIIVSILMGILSVNELAV